RPALGPIHACGPDVCGCAGGQRGRRNRVSGSVLDRYPHVAISAGRSDIAAKRFGVYGIWSRFGLFGGGRRRLIPSAPPRVRHLSTSLACLEPKAPRSAGGLAAGERKLKLANFLPAQTCIG